MREINLINVNLPMETDVYQVGHPVDSPRDTRIITEIRENSIEAEQNFVHIIEILVGNEVVREIINTPMTVEFGGKNNA